MKMQFAFSSVLLALLILPWASCVNDLENEKNGENVQTDLGAVLTQVSTIESSAIESTSTDIPPAPILISITDEDVNSSNDNPKWQELFLLEDDQVQSAAMSPDGEMLAVGNTLEVCLYQLASSKKVLCMEIQDNLDDQLQPWSRTRLLWSPNGTHLAYFMGNHKTIVHIWDTVTGELLLEDELEIPRKFLSKTWTLSGESLAVGNLGGGLWIWDIDNPEELKKMKEYPWSPYGLTWLPHGELLSMDDINNIEGIWNVASGELIVEVEINADGANRIYWSPDVSTVASFIPGYGIRVFDAVNGELIIHESTGNHITWSPKGEFIAIPRFDNVVVWESGDRELLVEITGNMRGVWGVAWSQSGDLLAFVDYDGTLVVIDSEAWSLLSVSKRNIESIIFVDWTAEDLLVVGGIIDEHTGFWFVTID